MTEGYASIQEALYDYIRLCKNFCLLYETEQPDAAEQVQPLLQELAEKHASSTFPLPLTQLCSRLGLHGFAWFCVLLSLGCELDGELRNRMQTLTGLPVPTFDTAAGLYLRYDGSLPPTEPIALADPQSSPLSSVFFLENRPASQPMVFAPLVLRLGALQFLTQGKIGAHALYTKDVSPSQCANIQEHLLADIQAALLQIGQTDAYYLFLSGRGGSGKRTLLLRAASARGMAALFVDCRTLDRLDDKAILPLFRDLTLDMLLSPAVLCCTHYETAYTAKLERLLQEIPAQTALVLLVNDAETTAPLLRGKTPLRHHIDPLSRADYAKAVSFFSERVLAIDANANFYRLTIGELKAALGQARQSATKNRSVSFQRLFAQAVQMQSKPLAMAQSIDPENTLADLILDDEATERIQMLCTMIRTNQETIARPQIKGVTALFYGPSGTGKTMAAGALANELGLELLKIDLSRVMDKYIGETEKHLGELFAAAKERNCLLFFDEADALFGKRTEITSSHDRYANVETSFLLQSIESFEGAVILSTNLFKNFDEAFLRRIQMVVRFSMPNEKRRLTLWEKVFAGISLDRGIDLQELAERDDFSPAMIANIANTLFLLRHGRDETISAQEFLTLVEMEKKKQ